MAKTAEELELEKQQSDAVLKANTEALREEAIRESNDALATKALEQTHSDEASALADNNQSQYDNLGQIIGDIQGKIDAAKKKDEAAVKRENAYRYISGLGDTLSSVANLVGTAHGASNQQQTYNSHAVVQKAEQARKERKLEMDDLNKRLEEMSARQRDLKAAGSLAEAQLKAKQDKEKFALQREQNKAALEADRYNREVARKAEEAETARQFQAQQAELNRKHQTAMNNADNATSLARTTSSGKGEEFNLGNGEFVSVPKDRMNEYNITELYDMVPDSVKKTAGRPKIDAYGEVIGYYPPTQKEMLQAINRAAQNDPKIKDAIRNLGAAATEGDTKPSRPKIDY